MKPGVARIDLTLDPFQTVGLLIHYIADQFRKKKFTDAVLGLSGGVDSALGAALLATALGPEHVTGVAMPAGESDPTSLRDARHVAETFGIRFAVQPVGAVADTRVAYIATFSELKKVYASLKGWGAA